MQIFANQESQLVSVLNDGRDASGAAPVVVQMSLLVRQQLHPIWLESAGVVDDVVRSWSNCALSDRLADQEEIVAEKKMKSMIE